MVGEEGTHSTVKLMSLALTCMSSNRAATFATPSAADEPLRKWATWLTCR